MIQNKVLRLKKDTKLPNGVDLKQGQEIEIVMDVVYMGGYPLPAGLQSTFLTFINDNGALFMDDTRKF